MSHPIRTSIYLLLLLFLIIATVSVYEWIYAPQVVTVSVLAVGKGNATLIQSRNGGTVLINTGGDASILRALGETLPLWQRNIDVLLLKDSSQNAMGGTPDVLKRYQVSYLMRFGTTGSKSLEAALASAAKEETGLVQTAGVYGMRLALDGEVYADILPIDTLTLFYGKSTFTISSTTAKGVYALNGKIVTKIK